jgi:hypothetical protein
MYSSICSGRGGGDDAAVGVYGEFLSISESLLFMCDGVGVADHPPPAPTSLLAGGDGAPSSPSYSSGLNTTELVH